MNGEVFVEIKKKCGGRGVGCGVRLGGQGRCEQRSEVFVKIQKKNFFFFFFGGGGVGHGGAGVSMDVKVELKFL